MLLSCTGLPSPGRYAVGPGRRILPPRSAEGASPSSDPTPMYLTRTLPVLASAALIGAPAAHSQGGGGAAPAPRAGAPASHLDSATLASFRWRGVGPANMGGRVADVVGIPSPSKTFYVAAAAGGIWKTSNAGTTFRPVFDDQRVISMGALAIAPSDTTQVWAGTGEQNSRNSISPGGGIYKSTDGGRSW